MPLIIALVRVALSAIFVLAGITKLLDQRGTREAVANFGAPKSWAPAVAVILPLLELIIAIGLLFNSSMWASAVGAFILLGLFIVAIGVNLARGQTHDCHCFGQIYSRPLGWPTLARNIIFALAAVVVLWQAHEATQIAPTIGEAVAGLSTAESVLLLSVLVGATGALIYLLRKRGRSVQASAKQAEGLPIDSIAPAFELPAYDGGTKSLAQLLAAGKPLLLIFTNPNCGPCVAIFKQISDWQDAHEERLTIALISIGTIKENFVNVAKNRLGQVLLQEKREVGEQYGATATPTAVVVNTNGRIASKLAAGGEEIRQLLETLVGSSPVSNNHHHDHGVALSSHVAAEDLKPGRV